MRTRINGYELGFEVLSGTGPTLLLIHGLGLNRMIWRPMADQCLRGYRVILPDVRGHGESPISEGETRIEGLAEDLLRLMDHLEIEKVVAGGHSMGGYIALAMACQHPDRLAGLGMIASRAAADNPEKRGGRDNAIREIRFRGSQSLAESLAPRLTRSSKLQMLVYSMIENTQPAGLTGALQAIAGRTDRMAFLPEICIPVLVAAGTQDQIVPLAETKEMVTLFPDCTYLEITAAGHLPMLEAPEILGEGLRSFMEKCCSED